MLRTAKTLLGDRTIQGLAPSAAAARVLEREAGIPSRTLQYFLTRFGGEIDPRALAQARGVYAGSVLAVDEASMIDTVRMRDLLAIAADLRVARVALVGDTAQLRAVDAGQPFRLLQRAGMTTATMDEVLRQRDPELRRAVGLAREGEAGAAIAGLGARVREAPREALGGEAARRWLALAPERRPDTLLLAPTHAIRRQANDVVREGLARKGRLHGRTLAVDRLVDRRLTRAQAADIASYEPGDTVVFHRDHYGCRRDDVCTVRTVLDAAAAPGSDGHALSGIAREASAIGRDVAESDIAAHLAALGAASGTAPDAAPGAAPDALGATAAARVAADNRARLLKRIARNRDRARKLGIAEFDTSDWPAIAEDSRALLDAGTVPVVDRTPLEHALAREAAHRAEKPEIPSPRLDPGIGF